MSIECIDFFIAVLLLNAKLQPPPGARSGVHVICGNTRENNREYFTVKSGVEGGESFTPEGSDGDTIN